jgi:hypothetical protein
VLATGFPPGAFLTFRADNQAIGSGQADPAGAFDNAGAAFSPPFLPSAVNIKTFQLTADDGQGTMAGPVPVPVSRVTVSVPAFAHPHQRVRFRVYGFEAGKPVYLHIRRHDRTLGRFDLGTTAAPCGTVTRRMWFMPLRSYTIGTYRYFFSHSRRFDRTKVIFGGRVTIGARLKTSAAQATAAGSWG